MVVHDPVEAELFGSRVLVLSKEKGAALYTAGFYGKPVNVHKPKDISEVNTQLELSLFEATLLCQQDLLEIRQEGRNLSTEDLLCLSRKSYHLFDELYTVYKDLREKGYVVRPALKFGADFAVYRQGPGIDHAPFIIHVLPNSAEVDPIEIVRAGRLSHTVRKKFVLATIDRLQQKIYYYVFNWWKA